jgi:ribosome-associated protein
MPRYNIHDEIDDFEDTGPSKTEQKKAMDRLQALGERLAELRMERLKKMPLTERLIIAIGDLKKLKSMEAIRRQKQYIGKLMRDEDEAAILAVLNPLANPALNRQLEVLLEKMLEQGDNAINDVVRRYPTAERHTLRQHVRATLKEKQLIEEKPEPLQVEAEKPARQKLITYLREIAALMD